MSVIALLLAQAAAPQPGDPGLADPPSIEIRAEIRADKVVIENGGEISVQLDGHPLADKDQRTERNQEKGRKSYSDLVIRTHSSVTLADPLAALDTAAAQTSASDQAEGQITQIPTTKTGNDQP